MRAPLFLPGVCDGTPSGVDSAKAPVFPGFCRFRDYIASLIAQQDQQHDPYADHEAPQPPRLPQYVPEREVAFPPVRPYRVSRLPPLYNNEILE